jgi:hypothetical protein
VPIDLRGLWCLEWCYVQQTRVSKTIQILLSGAFALTASCASKPLEAPANANEVLAQKEYEDVLQVQEITPSGEYVRLPGPAPKAPSAKLTPAPKVAAVKKAKNEKVKATPTPTPAIAGKKEPEFEDAAGFIGRRPIKDPFRVGEKVVLEASYFGVAAGDISLSVEPSVHVNGRKSYHFKGNAESTSVFAMFYAVEDWFETFLDYETLLPFNYRLSVKESKQLRETRSYFDWDKLKGFYWDKRITKEKGVEEQKIEWNILNWSQNLFSAAFYLRTFQIEPGKKLQFRVGHEGKNILVTGTVIRREVLDTRIGKMKTLVLSPRIEIEGVFKPMGDINFWLTDDDRKFIVRIESKIKIGKIIAELKKLDKGGALP